MKATIVTAALLAALAAGATANAAPRSCDLPGNVINNTRGFKVQLVDSIRPYSSIRNARVMLGRIVPVVYCGPGAAPATAAVKASRRFYTLLAGFPVKPTQAQWNARWRPLVAAAAAVDADYLAVVSQVFAADPSYGGLDRVGMTSQIRADLVWLNSHMSAPYGKPVV